MYELTSGHYGLLCGWVNLADYSLYVQLGECWLCRTRRTWVGSLGNGVLCNVMTIRIVCLRACMAMLVDCNVHVFLGDDDDT